VEPNARRVRDHDVGFGEKLGPVRAGVHAGPVSVEQVRPAYLHVDATKRRSLCPRYLGLLNDTDAGGPVRLQDYRDVCDAMSATPQGIDALADYLTGNLEGILRTVPTGESVVTYMYWLLATRVALDGEIVKVSESTVSLRLSRGRLFVTPSVSGRSCTT